MGAQSVYTLYLGVYLRRYLRICIHTYLCIDSYVYKYESAHKYLGVRSVIGASNGTQSATASLPWSLSRTGRDLFVFRKRTLFLFHKRATWLFNMSLLQKSSMSLSYCFPHLVSLQNRSWSIYLSQKSPIFFLIKEPYGSLICLFYKGAPSPSATASVLQCVAVCCSVLQCVAVCLICLFYKGAPSPSATASSSVLTPQQVVIYFSCGVATVSRIDQRIRLLCRISSLLWGSFAKETYN